MNLILLSSFIACSNGQKSTDTSSADANDTSEDSTTEPGTENQPDEGDPDPSNGSAPEVTSFDAWCYADSNGVDTWGFAIDYTDPDGDDTIPGIQPGAIRAFNGGGEEVATGDPVCDRNGNCFANIVAAQLGGIGCAAAESTSFSVTLVDEDGNSSNTAEATGRVGTNVEG